MYSVSLACWQLCCSAKNVMQLIVDFQLSNHLITIHL